MSTAEEIVWISGDEPDHVLVRSPQEGDSTHYFYFPTQKLPWFKTSDIEPVRRGKTTVISRLHYHGLVAWVAPLPKKIDNETRAVCVFLFSSHTPLLLSDEYKTTHVAVEDTGGLGRRDKAIYALGYVWLKANLRRRKQPDVEARRYRGKISVGVPGGTYLKGKILLDLEYVRHDAKYLVLIGPKNVAEEMLKDVRKNGHGRVTSESIIQTLGL